MNVETDSEFFVEHLHNAQYEAATCAADQLDALATECLDMLYGQGIGAMMWSVVRRLSNPRDCLLNELRLGIEREQRVG